MPQDCPVIEVIVQAFIWESFARGATVFQVSAKPLHRKGPVAPNWAPALNVVCNVKEGVDGKGANRKALWISLKVNPIVRQHGASLEGKLNLLFISFNPLDESRSEQRYLCS